MKIKLFFPCMVALTVALPQLVKADEIVIKDCQGITRAAEEVEANSKNNVKLNIADSSGATMNGSSISLANQFDGSEIWGKVEAGVASFDQVTPGLWTACSKSTNSLVISRVSVVAPTTAEEAGNSWLLPAAIIAGGGGIIIAGASDDDNDSGDSTLDSPAFATGGSTETVSLTTPSGSTSASSHSNSQSGSSSKDSNTGKRPSGPKDLDDEDCGTEEELTPVSPYQ